MSISKNTWSGKALRGMFCASTNLLKQNVQSIDALNVFPVPDGDTGTNMFLTMQSALSEAKPGSDNDASAVAQAMAQGALMGARGNSGVILSMMIRGLAQGLAGKQEFNAQDLAGALASASEVAYKAVTSPAEGTMLTVMREASAIATSLDPVESDDLDKVLEAVLNEARESVIRTPTLLPVLREAGVVDAGGYGLSLIFEGMLRYLRGDDPAEEGLITESQPIISSARVPDAQVEYGYCTNFLVYGNNLDLDEIRKRIESMGESVLVVGGEEVARVHVHTFDPGAILSYGISLGTLRQICVDNMEDQHREFVAAQNERLLKPVGDVAIVAVAYGTGLADVFKSIGATEVISSGGVTGNPSVEELLRAVESVPAQGVIILPNDLNILPAALQIKNMTGKQVEVVPSRTMPQGVAALLAFDLTVSVETNFQAMSKRLSTVRTGEVTTAVRSMTYNGINVKKGQVVGLIDGELAVAESNKNEAVQNLLKELRAQDGDIMTVYYGNNIDWADAEKFFGPIRAQYGDLEIEMVFGGQPHYDYLLSLE